MPRMIIAAAVIAMAFIIASCVGGGSGTTVSTAFTPTLEPRMVPPVEPPVSPGSDPAALDIATLTTGGEEKEDDEDEDEQPDPEAEALRLAGLEALRLRVADLLERADPALELSDDLDALLEKIDIKVAAAAPDYPLLGWNAAPVVDLDTDERFYKHCDTCPENENDPLRELSGIRHVGGEVAPTAALTSTTSHGAASISHGTLQEATSRADLVEFLVEQAELAESWELKGLPIGEESMTVRIVAGVSERFESYIERAVRAINSALPPDRRIVIGATIRKDDEETLRDALEGLPDNTLVVHAGLRDRGGVVRPRSYFAPFEYGGNHEQGLTIEKGYLFINADPEWYFLERKGHGELDREQRAIGLIAHEISHGLGFLEHPDDTESVLSYDTPYEKRMGHFLYRIDRDALLAAYEKLDAYTASEDIETDLGSWSTSVMHVRGEISLEDDDTVAFGTALSNGFPASWAQGPIPDTDLADNTELTGNATWAGRLLGLTPGGRAVAGSAALAVDLDDLDGRIDFAALEQWSSTRPGSIGTGTSWGDGDLGYTIAVDGNIFVRTGGDDGMVTGAFFGAAHEGMGGTLERDDLSAGFGGKR